MASITLAGVGALSESSGVVSLDSAMVFPAGHVLQVQSSAKLDPGSISSSASNTYQNWPGTDQDGSGSSWVVNITPSSTSSKILLMLVTSINESTSATMHIRFARGGTGIGIGNAGQANQLRDTVIERHQGAAPYTLMQHNMNAHYLDSPSSTSALVYSVQGTLGASYTGTYYIGRTASDGNADYEPRTISVITAMEIKG